MHEKATVTGLLYTIFFLGLIRKAATTDKCNGPRQIPIQGKMLKGHIYETRWVRSGYAECLFICREEKVCQSFNFMVKESKCEFNNRTKEACSPEDFVLDPHRLYVKLDVSRVPLGSIPELPATSCQEINKNEGKKFDSGKYWMSLSGTIVHGYCNMSTVPEDIDECKSESHDCHVNANCTNTLGSYNCSCWPGYKGNGTICTDLNECSSNFDNCHVNAICHNTVGSYTCSCKPGYKGDGRTCSPNGLQDSVIVGNNRNHLTSLNNWLLPVTRSVYAHWRHCWRASVDGWAARTFHSRCDGEGPTVTIIRVGSYIFGGYASVSWASGNRWQYDSKAFLFSLENKPGWASVKLNQTGKDSSSLRFYSWYGPTFGGGYDIHLSNYASTNNNSYSRLGHTYNPPRGYSFDSAFAKAFLAGAYHFQPDEIETLYEII